MVPRRSLQGLASSKRNARRRNRFATGRAGHNQSRMGHRKSTTDRRSWKTQQMDNITGVAGTEEAGPLQTRILTTIDPQSAGLFGGPFLILERIASGESLVV